MINSSKPIEFDTIVRDDVSFFVIDTETTGSVGVPFWFQQNQIIQLSVLSLETKEYIDEYVKLNEDQMFLPLENIQTHKIVQGILRQKGRSAAEVLELSEKFKTENGGSNKIIVNIGHNVQFDYDMIMKSYFENKDQSFGRGCCENPEYYFDTLACFKDLYPELGKIFLERDAPYKLSNLVKYYLPGVNIQGAHNALVDVNATAALFTKMLYPKLPKDFNDWKKWLVCNHAPEKHLGIMPVVDINGFGDWRVSILAQICRETFASHPSKEIQDLRVPEGYFTVNYLTSCGYIKYLQNISQTSDYNDDSWYSVCQFVEQILRTQLKIYSDKIIVGLLSRMCNSTELDFTLHSFRSESKQPIYPTMPGLPISYLPLDVDELQAKRLHESLGVRTISELYVKFKFLPDYEKIILLNEINLDRLNAISLNELNEIFDKVIQYGG